MTQTMFTVEGSRPLRQMAAFSLRQAGCEMIEGGWAGWTEQEQGTADDRVLAEQNMPDMDGLCLIKVLRTMKNYQNVPIVVLTTESGDAVQALGKVVGANGWMAGPLARCA